MKTYTVIYRTGGTENAQWHKSAAVETMAQAIERKQEIERGGRKAIIHETARLESIGMPVGWDSK